MSMLHRIWKDEAGFVVSTELVLIATILVIGLIVGLTTVRDQVVQELGDLAMAIGNVNQSYTYNGVTGHTSATDGSTFNDEPDFCEQTPVDPTEAEPACISVQLPPSYERNPAPSPDNS